MDQYIPCLYFLKALSFVASITDVVALDCFGREKSSHKGLVANANSSSCIVACALALWSQRVSFVVLDYRSSNAACPLHQATVAASKLGALVTIVRLLPRHGRGFALPRKCPSPFRNVYCLLCRAALLFFFAVDTCDSGGETNRDGEEGVKCSATRCQ